MCWFSRVLSAQGRQIPWQDELEAGVEVCQGVLHLGGQEEARSDAQP